MKQAMHYSQRAYLVCSCKEKLPQLNILEKTIL